jgi:hypothetical protein
MQNKFSPGQLRVSRKLEELSPEEFLVRGSRAIEDEIARKPHSDLKC